VPIQYQEPKIVHCFDGVPHQAGSQPWVLGGTCCCTPTDQLMAAYHRDGFYRNMQTADLLALYQEKGIHLVTDHARCNNLCEYGPHVVFGGHCMVAPTPGTRNYEEVITGTSYARQPASALATDASGQKEE
jgi:hypothetical protein